MVAAAIASVRVFAPRMGDADVGFVASCTQAESSASILRDVREARHLKGVVRVGDVVEAAAEEFEFPAGVLLLRRFLDALASTDVVGVHGLLLDSAINDVQEDY